MDFALTPEQERIQATARTFAERHLRPHYQARDGEAALDRAMVREMGALGLIAPVLPEAMGGLGLDCVTMGLLVEEVSRGDFNVGYVQLLGALNGQILARHASAPRSAETASSRPAS